MDENSNADDMLPAERRQRLADWFIKNVAASNQELARVFNTSVSTIRRDLDHLASQDLVRRTHGGAVRVRRRATFEPTTDEARQTAVEEKHAIAVEAARRLEPDQSILIDTGSTLHEFAKVVAELTIPLTVVTNDVYVAGILSNKPHIKLVVPGGNCRDGAYTLLGEPGISFLKDIRCDQFFVCSQAVDLECISDTSLELVQLKRAMMAAAEKTILLVDSSKFPTRAFYRIGTLDLLSEIITDDGLSDEDKARLDTVGVRITRAEISDSLNNDDQ